MRRRVVGVMGPGAGASERDTGLARELGALVARRGWVLITGGGREGVMDAASAGAHDAGGLVVGVLGGDEPRDASPWLDVAIVTGLGQGRNVINVLSSEVVVVCGMSAGTASEAALALRLGRPLVLLAPSAPTRAFFASVGGERVRVAESAGEAVGVVAELLDR